MKDAIAWVVLGCVLVGLVAAAYFVGSEGRKERERRRRGEAMEEIIGGHHGDHHEDHHEDHHR